MGGRADDITSHLVILHYVRADTLLRRRLLTRTISAWASCAGGAVSRVGRTAGIRRNMSTGDGERG